MAKPIALIVAAVGFQPVEYHDTRTALENAGLKVITVSNTQEPAIASDHTTHVTVDFRVADVDPTQYDGIFLIGGPGALEHLHNKAVIKLMEKAHALHIPYGAICISPRILAEAGLLKGIRATGWNEDHKLSTIFADHGVKAEIDKSVVTDGRVITANGPRAARQFGEAIVKVVLAYNTEQRK